MAFKLGLKAAQYHPKDHPADLSMLDSSNIRSDFTIDIDVPVVDQKNTVPCCVSIAVTTCLEVLDLHPSTPLSFLFNYYFARPDSSKLVPIEIRDGLIAAAKYGVCQKSLFNPGLSNYGATIEPPENAIDEARSRKIQKGKLRWAYKHFLENYVAEWKAYIADGYPVILGFQTTDDYHGINKFDPIHPIPTSRSNSSNGHAVVIVGYDDDKNCGSGGIGAFKIRDSRGNSFAKDGHWWLPYTLAESHIIMDSWTVTELTNN